VVWEYPYAMFRSKYPSQYRFYIEEVQSDKETFTIIHPHSKTVYDIVEEAARLYYYGMRGWEEAWPLTFVIESMKGVLIVKAHVYIVSGVPDFEVIPCEIPPGPPQKALKAQGDESDKESQTSPLGAFWAMLRGHLGQSPPHDLAKADQS
jgi:hypothetical protein